MPERRVGDGAFKYIVSLNNEIDYIALVNCADPLKTPCCGLINGDLVLAPFILTRRVLNVSAPETCAAGRSFLIGLDEARLECLRSKHAPQLRGVAAAVPVALLVRV